LLIVATGGLRPALVSILGACKYMGGVSRAKFYEDLLPHLETVHIGSRHFVVVESMDRLIAESKVVLDETPHRRGRLRPASEAKP
jgi:hypothetical protein